jgi:anti-anti-sigma factor
MSGAVLVNDRGIRAPGATMRCSFEVGIHSGFDVVYVHGDLDALMCPEFDSRINALTEGPARCVILDLLDVPYSEAAPLRAVVIAHRSLVDSGKALAVVCCAPFMDRLIKLAGVHGSVPLFHDLDSAASHLSTLC